MQIITANKTTNYKLECRSWTHIHIGSGVELSRWEYFVYREKLALLNTECLYKEASRNSNFIDELTELAGNNEKSKNLEKFLQDFSKRHNDKGIKERLAGPKPVLRSFPEGFENKVMNLKLFAGSPNCYIPGSSVKGALRTAFIDANLGRMPYELEQLRDRLNDTMQPNSSDSEQIFRHIIVTDSKNIPADNLAIASVSIYSGSGGDSYAEVLLCKKDFELLIAARESKLENPAIPNLKQLLEYADQFYRRVWNDCAKSREQIYRDEGLEKDIADFYKDSPPPNDHYLLRVGYGSGQTATSVLLKYRNQHNADRELRTGVYKSNPDKLNRRPYPYTAKSAVAAAPVVPVLGQMQPMSGYSSAARSTHNITPGERKPLGWVIISKNLEIVNAD